MGVEPKHISFRYLKNRWGSCSSTNRISFNYHLVKLSSSLIEYVVIHELAHIVHQNHSKEFWKLLHKHLADYKIKEDKIKTHLDIFNFIDFSLWYILAFHLYDHPLSPDIS